MAIIGKIRDNSVLVIGIVGLSLALFIVDLPSLTSGGGSENPNSIGEFFGEPIDGIRYDSLLKEGEKNAEMYMMRQGMEMTPEVLDDVRQQIWEDYIEELIYNRELAHFPFLVNADELNDMVHGVDLHPEIANAEIFKDPLGNFSKDSIAKYLQRLEQDSIAKKSWKAFEKTMKKDRLREKYDRLISQSLYITSSEAKKDFTASTQMYKIRFVMKPYYEIPDSSVQVTDADIRAYYEKNKKRKQFENLGSRTYEYVEFDIKATEKDKLATEEEMKFIAEDFKKSTNDSAFVMQYSESKMYMPTRWSSHMDGFPADIDAKIQAADSGTVIGPYFQNDVYKIIKVIESKDTALEQVYARHILLGAQDGTPEQLKAKADTILAEIKAKNNFVEMSDKHSIDKFSAANGGSLDWFGKGRMVAPFEEACFKAKTGDLVIVETQFGVHIVEILGKRDKCKTIRYNTVDKRVKPLQETTDKIREKASEFRDAIPDGTKFEETAKKFGLTVLEGELYDSQRKVNGLENSRNLAVWMLNSAENDVSSPETCGEKIIVARLENIKEKGVPKFDDVKEIMEFPAREQKKGDLLVKQMSGASSLEELAVKLGTTIKDSVEISFGSLTVPKAGAKEPEVIGTVTSLSKNQKGAITIPIKGKMGVYVVQLVDVYEATATGKTWTDNKTNMTLTRRSMASQKAFDALKKKGNLVDKRNIN